MSTDDTELAKDLGPLAALTIGVGTMIGAGIFVLPGTAIENAGWYAVLSFILGGAIALFTAFSVSELHWSDGPWAPVTAGSGISCGWGS